ncbi:MAG: penicillin-binding protein 2 [Pseudoxanthomonas suwonensis]|nr:penicillin-binding protein 2 [Pseudoxanthomonas suwonensis]
MRRHRVRDARGDLERFRLRAAIGFAVVLLSFAGLALWYFRLQIVDHEDYATRSEANRVRPQPIVPGRGLIFDRNGELLADNEPAYRLDVLPVQAGDPDVLIANLQQLVALDAEDIARFHEARRAGRGFRPVTLKLRMAEEEMARFAVERWRFPGVDIVPYLGRVYPHGELLAHVIGYVGRVDARDLEAMDTSSTPFSHVGKTGLERFYDEQLRGKPGYRRIETNAHGRPVRTLGTVPATAGTDLRLSIDLRLQQAMVAAFGEHEGSAVAVDPRTGEILAMVSLPAFDPNLFVNGISRTDFAVLNENPSRPQFNRLVLGGVAPGSTLKPMIALAGLDSGLRRPDDRVMSTGMFYLPGTRRGWGDAARGGHGSTDLRKSVAQSVNTYYYRLALDLGIERFAAYMSRYGFGEPTGIDLTGEIPGILPSPQQKQSSRKERWYPGDTLNAAIGQGDWKVTPLQLVAATAAMADGQLRRPHLAAQQRIGFDAEWSAMAQPPARAVSDSPANLAVIREAMHATMLPGGTGWRVAAGAPYSMAGKTGTAQVASRRGSAAVNPRSLPMHLRHRALFVGFAPVEAPSIALAVAVEGGGYGGTTAAPIARRIFDAWLLGTMPETPEPAPVESPAVPAEATLPTATTAASQPAAASTEAGQ